MGSPLSPVLANLYMEYYETELLPQISPSPPLWLRYVDDVILAWDQQTDFQGFLSQVNDLTPSIKFTTEWEQDRSLPFLDARIHRQTSGFLFEIYRKPTHSGQYLHFYSFQPDSVKKSTLFSLLLRAYRIADYPYLQREINILYDSFRKIGYPPYFIDSVHSNVKRKFFSQNSPRPRPPRVPTISLPFNTFTSSYVRPMFRAQGLDVVNSAQNSLKSQLVRTRPASTVPGLGEGGGVYIVPCHGCESVYVGETGRNLETRIGEHRYAITRQNRNNGIFKHMWDTGHTPRFGESRMIYKSDNKYNRLTVESSCILTTPNFNNMQSTLAIDNLSQQIILKSNPTILRNLSIVTSGVT